MNLEFINPFVRSTVAVLTTMASLEIEKGKPFLANQNLPGTDISGLVDIKSDSASGILAVSFSQPVMFAIVKNMIGEQPEELNDLVEDVAGEVTNMIYGGAKAELDNAGYNFDMAIPLVVYDVDENIDFPKGSPIVVVPFSTPYGELYINISYEAV